MYEDKRRGQEVQHLSRLYYIKWWLCHCIWVDPFSIYQWRLKENMTLKNQNATSHGAHDLISFAESLIQKELHLHLSQLLSNIAVFAHAYIPETWWTEWATFSFTVSWHANSVPGNDFTLRLMEEKMILDWRGKEFTWSEFPKIVFDDPRCAIEVVYSPPHIVRNTVETNHKKQIPLLSLYILFSAEWFNPREDWPTLERI